MRVAFAILRMCSGVVPQYTDDPNARSPSSVDAEILGVCDINRSAFDDFGCLHWAEHDGRTMPHHRGCDPKEKL